MMYHERGHLVDADEHQWTCVEEKKGATQISGAVEESRNPSKIWPALVNRDFRYFEFCEGQNAA
jgi:hypothetical protein